VWRIYPSSDIHIHNCIVILVVVPLLFPELSVPGSGRVSRVPTVSRYLLYGSGLYFGLFMLEMELP